MRPEPGLCMVFREATAGQLDLASIYLGSRHDHF
jgi:hypothetical protein